MSGWYCSVPKWIYGLLFFLMKLILSMMVTRGDPMQSKMGPKNTVKMQYFSLPITYTSSVNKPAAYATKLCSNKINISVQPLKVALHKNPGPTVHSGSGKISISRHNFKESCIVPPHFFKISRMKRKKTISILNRMNISA